MMTTTLGAIDAKRLSIDVASEGDTVDVDGEAAGELIKRGWAVQASNGGKAPAPAPPASLTQPPKTGGAKADA